MVMLLRPVTAYAGGSIWKDDGLWSESTVKVKRRGGVVYRWLANQQRAGERCAA